MDPFKKKNCVFTLKITMPSIQQSKLTLGTDCHAVVHGHNYTEELEDLLARYAPFFSGADLPLFYISLAGFCLLAEQVCVGFSATSVYPREESCTKTQ